MKEKLYVPTNIPLRREWWPGFGDKELITTIITFVVSVICAIVSVAVFKVNALFVVFGFLGIMALTVSLIQKNENKLSIVDYIKIMLSFKNEQQIYDYKYKEEKTAYATKTE